LSTRVGDAQGTGAVGERQAFNAKTPVCVSVICVDIAAFMPEMQLAFPQKLQRWLACRARSFAGPPVQERRGNLGVEHVELSSAGWHSCQPKASISALLAPP
jgi:hypothetical protein